MGYTNDFPRQTVSLYFQTLTGDSRGSQPDLNALVDLVNQDLLAEPPGERKINTVTVGQITGAGPLVCVLWDWKAPN